MIQLDVCLEMVLPHLPTEERIARIAEAGYDCVEFWFHDAAFDGTTCNRSQPRNAAALRQACESAKVTLNNIVVNAPDGSFGGSPVDETEHNQYLERLDEVIAFAQAAGCNKAITCTGNSRPHLSRNRMRDNLLKVYSQAAAVAAKSQFTLLLEPLNTLVDHPGYYLNSSADGAEIVREISSPNFRLLYDVYHMQIMEGNVIANIEKQIDVIGHFHSAGVPGRHELFGSELNYPAILARIEAAGYQGRFGLEYAPAMENHQESLRQNRLYLQGSGD